VIAQVKTLTSPIELRPFGVTVPAPSFAIATGDLTEFGGLNGWWEDYLRLWQGAPFPVYHESGNHDSTWACQRYQIRKLHGGAYYSFNHAGCHFIGWDSATPQDPRPSFGEEGIRWLREDLRKVSPETPIFLFCHHPVDSGELASLYERDRLLDILRPYNLALLLVGHGHAAQHRVVAGVDQVMGGSTFGAAPGYSVVSVKDGVLRVAYRRAIDAVPARKLLERPLNARSAYPAIRIQSPDEGETLRGTTFRLRASIRHPEIRSARWVADDEKGREGALSLNGSAWEAELDARDWEPGCHYVRVVFTAADGKEYQRTVRFYTPSPERVLWRAQMGGSGKGSPVVDGDLVVSGAGDGGLYAFDARTGRRRWTFRTGGEILAQPLAHEGAYYVGSGDTHFYAVDRRGRERWKIPVGHPVYSGAVLAGGSVVFAANNGHSYGVDPAPGKQRWVNTEPTYAIESRPWVEGSTVYYGSWDGDLYAVDAATGRSRWKVQGAGSAAYPVGLVRYYAPADAGPVVAGGKVWVADRSYRLTVVDAETGLLRDIREQVASVARSEDGRAVYLRRTDGNLVKLSTDGAELWRAPAMTNVLPSAPAERGGVVYSASPTGRILAFDAASGQKRWEYQATPRLYVFADPVPAARATYVAGMDGSLTALRP
jgi:outer membrane protein assembly factor BamB